MEKIKIIRADAEQGIWEEIKADMDSLSYPFIYRANIKEHDKSVFLNIEVDLGGGFESGFQATSMTAPVPIHFTTLSSPINEQKEFRFALHDEDFIDKVGKFFGMEDVETGYGEFDKKLIVKTNDPDRIKSVFADIETRKVFETLGGFNLHVAYYDNDDQNATLELVIDRDITDVNELQKIYNAFGHVLTSLERNKPV